MLDEAGFQDARIVASNDLDEYVIESLIAQGSRIDVWGVGTQLVTSKNEPALGGVYKLVEIAEGDHFRPTLKVSSNPGKVTSPGKKQIYRGIDADGHFVGDCIALAEEDLAGAQSTAIFDPLYVSQEHTIQAQRFLPLLEKVLWEGGRIPNSTLKQLQERTLEQLKAIPQPCRRLQNPHLYPVGLSPKLFDLRNRLLKEYRERA